MYVGKVEPVEIPKSGGKTRRNTSGYIWWITESKWDNDLGYTKDNRITIGKEVPGRPGWIYPNNNFFKLFGDKLASEKQLPVRGEFSVLLNYGAYAALHAAAEKIGCLEVLRQTFPDVCERIFSIALHSIDAENSVAQDYSNWIFWNYCGISKNYSDSEVSALYKDIGSRHESMLDFMRLFREAYFKAVPDSERGVLAFDSTNQNTSSCGISLAEFGHAKLNENLPDINTALFVDEKTSIPLYYEHFYGSLLDKTETPTTLSKAKELGFQKLFLMMDRGYMSREALNALKKDNKFAVMCPSNLVFVRELIAANRQEIKDRENHYIPSENIYGIHVPGVEYDGEQYDAYVFYDGVRAQEERESIHNRLNFWQADVMNRKRYSEALRRRYAPYLNVVKTETKDSEGRNFSVKVNHDKVQEYIDDAGYFVILSNAGLPVDRMIEIARMRDRGEKAFRRLKYHFGLTKTYTHSTATYHGKMFIAFVALIIVESFRYFAKEILKSKTSMTTKTLLAELRKYQIRYTKNGKWEPQYAMTASQKRIFKLLDRNSREVTSAVHKIHLRVQNARV